MEYHNFYNFDYCDNCDNSDKYELPINKIIFHNFFKRELFCNSINLHIDLSKKELLKYEASDKIFLPKSALCTFASYSKDNIYLLKIFNPKSFEYAFVGVADFSAPDRMTFIPNWLMDYISIKNGDNIYVDAISVPKITYAQFKMPIELKEINIDIKSVLEFSLRNHCLLFLGKKIQAKIFEKIWEFEVIKLNPINVGNIVNLDVQLDIV